LAAQDVVRLAGIAVQVEQPAASEVIFGMVEVDQSRSKRRPAFS
jgi:hypothetical protein